MHRHDICQFVQQLMASRKGGICSSENTLYSKGRGAKHKGDGAGWKMAYSPDLTANFLVKQKIIQVYAWLLYA